MMGGYENPNYKHQWYLKNIEKIKKKRLDRYYGNKEKELKYSKKYKKDNVVRIRKIRIENQRDYKKRYPEKIKATSLSYSKIKIPKGMICERCCILQAKHKHHPDYSKPLEIQYLCIQCHNDLHNEQRCFL